MSFRSRSPAIPWRTWKIAAVESIRADYGSSLATVQWVITAYFIALVVSLPTSGWMGSRFGYGRVWGVGEHCTDGRRGKLPQYRAAPGWGLGGYRGRRLLADGPTNDPESYRPAFAALVVVAALTVASTLTLGSALRARAKTSSRQEVMESEKV